MVSSSEKEMLKDKENKFKLAIFEAAEKLGVPQPKVNIGECPLSLNINPDEIAHCHHDLRLICISKRKLSILSYEQIINTANHEVTHLIHPHHESSFHQTHQDLNVSTWHPPAGEGIQAFSEASLKRVKIDNSPVNSKPDRRKCNYYQSLKHKKGKLKQCKHCNRYFCDNHIAPRKSSFDKLDLPSKDEIDKSHPCFGYNTYLDNKLKEREQAYSLALERMVRKSKEKEIEPQREIPHIPVSELIERIKKNNRKNRFKIFKRIKDSRFIGRISRLHIQGFHMPKIITKTLGLFKSLLFALLGILFVLFLIFIFISLPDVWNLLLIGLVIIIVLFYLMDKIKDFG